MAILHDKMRLKQENDLECKDIISIIILFFFFHCKIELLRSLCVSKWKTALWAAGVIMSSSWEPSAPFLFPQSFIKELDFVNGAQTPLLAVPPSGDVVSSATGA